MSRRGTKYNNEFVTPGMTIAKWTILDITDERSKAGSIIYKVKNNETGKIEYKTCAYLVQYAKRKSIKHGPGRYRHYVRIPLEELIAFGNNLKAIAPNLMKGISDKGLISPKEVDKLFKNVEAKAK